MSQGEVVPFSLEQMRRQYRYAGVTAALGRPGDRLHRRRAASAAAPRSTPGSTGARRRRCSPAGATEHAIADFADDDAVRICDEVEAALSVQTGARRPDPGERSPARRRRPPRLATATRSRGGCATTGRRRVGRAPEHDRDVPPACHGGRRPPAGRSPRRPRSNATALGADRARLHAADGSTAPSPLRRRVRVRRGDPDAGAVAALRMAPPRRAHASPSIRR